LFRLSDSTVTVPVLLLALYRNSSNCLEILHCNLLVLRGTYSVFSGLMCSRGLLLVPLLTPYRTTCTVEGEVSTIQYTYSGLPMPVSHCAIYQDHKRCAAQLIDIPHLSSATPPMNGWRRSNNQYIRKALETNEMSQKVN